MPNNFASNKTIIIAEMRLLNAIFLNPKLLTEYSINEDQLIHESAKSIFAAMNKLIKEHPGVLLTQQSVFQAYSAIDINASLDVLTNIIDVSTDKLENIDDIIADLKHAKNNLNALGRLDKIKDLIGENFIASDDTTKKLRTELQQIEQVLLSKNTTMGVQKINEWLDTHHEDFKERRNGKQHLFNDGSLDSLITTGPAPGNGGIIVAATGMGKTSYLLNLANQFINADIPTMFFELEMSGVSCMDRLLSMRLGIPHREIVNPQNVADFDSIYSAIQEERVRLEEHKYFRFCENPSLWIQDIKSHIIKFQNEIDQQYCIVLIDLLSLVKDFCTPKPGMSVANTMEFAINQMNELAKELGIHYIGSVQLNRTVEADKVHDVEDIQKLKPNRTAIKNSNALLERARYCLSLFRPKYYADLYLEEDPEAQLMQDIIQIKLLKQNEGSVGGYKMLFDPSTFSLLPLIEERLENEE